jgi:H+/Cl- antiporter ClcA
MALRRRSSLVIAAARPCDNTSVESPDRYESDRHDVDQPQPSAIPASGIALLLSGEDWRRRMALWGGAIAVALVAIVFAKLSDAAFALFGQVLAASPLWALIMTPSMFGSMAWITSRGLEPTRGSGIPQVIAALRLPQDWRDHHLSLRVSVAKILLTVFGLLGGASIGREGPTVHVAAGIMQTVGRWFGFRDRQRTTRFLLAGGAAGIAAAFNAPLAGVVFAIEELSSAFEHRFSGTLLTAVIVGGVVSLGLLGNYAYFGKVTTALPLGMGWLAVLACGVLCGLAGGGFSRLVLMVMDGRPRWLGQWRKRFPIGFAVGCGLLLAIVGITCGHGAFGTGYDQARGLLQGHATVGHEFGLVKFIANLLSSVAGIPGGLFSPALAVGAGLGHNISTLFPSVAPSAIVLLGMCAYLTGVTQAPLTSAVICMELTANNDLMLPVLAVALIARGSSALLCHTPIYKALALRLLVADASVSTMTEDEEG